jgi:hypothetical protein
LKRIEIRGSCSYKIAYSLEFASDVSDAIIPDSRESSQNFPQARFLDRFAGQSRDNALAAGTSTKNSLRDFALRSRFTGMTACV